LQGRVLTRLEHLSVAMDENATRLRAAIETSQRRIDAVMAAIREQISYNAPYGANDRISAQSPRMRDLIVELHEDWLMTSTSSGFREVLHKRRHRLRMDGSSRASARPAARTYRTSTDMAAFLSNRRKQRPCLL